MRPMRVLAAAFGTLLVVSSALAQSAVSAEATSEAALLALGQRLYRDGMRGSGEPLTALGAAQTRLSGKDAACATCHRRSGYGTSEGQFVIAERRSQLLSLE